MEIGVTTGRWIQPDPRLRIEAVLAWGRLGLAKPDVCSVNVHELGWVEICNAAASVGIGVELGVWTSGDAVTLRQQGHPPDDHPGARRIDGDGPGHGRRRSRSGSCARSASWTSRCSCTARRPVRWPVLEYALRTKQDTRIGFEDVLQRPDGWLATGNDDLVRSALAIRV